MRNCSSTYNLQQCSSLLEEALDANPDIVRFGVLYLRFWVQSWLSDNSTGIRWLCSIRSTHREGSLTDLDNKTAEMFASSWIGRTSAKAWKAFSCISRRCLFLRPPNKEDDLDEGQRREARLRNLSSHSAISSLSSALQFC